MKILICGASGFVGRHLTKTLQQASHDIVRGVRKPTLPTDIAVDFSKDTDKATWLARLNGIDAVINVVGVLRDTKAQPMLKLHEQTPLALFAACQEKGIERIVQGSALGVDQGIETPYFTTRRKAEDFVSKLPSPTRWLITRPSVIYGEGGASAKMFKLQASLPVHTLPAGGTQKLQPVHIDDICEAVTRWLADPDVKSQIVACIGAEATDMRGMLDSYRAQLGHNTTAVHINIPAPLVKLSARLGDFIPASPLCSDTLQMLNAGNTGDVAPFAKLLDRQPLSYRQFINRP